MEEQGKSPEETKLGKAQIIVAKQRNGPIGTIDLAFVGEFARFENLATGRPEIPPDATPVGDEGDIPF
jgi:replicative DNA helicase